MLFNALISNTDDHPRNHAVIAMDRNFRLAPAYDLTPSTPVSVERRDLAMSVGDAGRYAQADNISLEVGEGDAPSPVGWCLARTLGINRCC
jgi:serine/threonine-protein kinase HipA